MSELKEFKFDKKLGPSMLRKILSKILLGGAGVAGGMFYETGNIMTEEEEMEMLNQYAGNN